MCVYKTHCSSNNILRYNSRQRSTLQNMGWNKSILSKLKLEFSLFYTVFKALFNQVQMNPLDSSWRITSNVELIHAVNKLAGPL